ncbi:uncharacterized protein LOC144314033 isoform X3 [Canis aureus]
MLCYLPTQSPRCYLPSGKPMCPDLLYGFWDRLAGELCSISSLIKEPELKKVKELLISTLSYAIWDGVKPGRDVICKGSRADFQDALASSFLT